MLVLTVYVDQQLGKPLEDGKRGHSAVDAAFVPAVGSHFAADDEHFLGLDAHVVEICRDRRRDIIRKHGFHSRVIRAVAYEGAVGAFAQHEIERVDDE